ncbi:MULTISPECIES: DNA methyltransferase [Vibrio]|uniref:Site-specific DNA-methyltransferase n=1 Tax=Vibrio cholerae TaxID=666 RepID=A0A8B5ZKS0_VIBCL|nr:MULTISPECIES: DNA methyltransferase [Vibrio]ELL0575472.1 site-specific DNA-methyltransferase [Vibrio cholerae]ELT7225608.1 site-specific DNA-methyltransferase [Vibrio cholerae]MCO7019742.1 site-specific DNA-methyltransferase [Vibrio paracholerae]MCO7029120.1 site-specific DNA-methyltransferase [Vibrio paracholerae]MCO7066067.1 site-specific DNA-methyltransferase [Vibrio paracholerae]
MLSCDKDLLKRIEEYSLKDEAYWSFKGRSKRHHCHGLLQYPAMMVPEMQGELIDAVLSEDRNVKRLFDPFVGSGTTLGEAMCRGLDFLGIDINPLAILACEVKSGPLYIKRLNEKTDELLVKIKNDHSTVIAVKFDGINKWFLDDVQRELSAIYRAIKSEPSKWARKVFWLAMASTVRAVCNSRSSTYKLHIKSDKQMESIASPIEVFEKKIRKNIEGMAEQKKVLNENKVLRTSVSISDVVIKNIDTAGELKGLELCDLLVSSPPYGDNQTTVTYGQFSYLPLKWLDLNDIDNLTQTGLLAHQSAIDSMSLGGSRKDSKDKYDVIKERSLSLVDCVDKIKKVNHNNIKKLIAFVFDLDKAIINSLGFLRKDAYMIWTLGNRRISNIEVPLDNIMRELLEFHGCHFVHKLEREIPSKRMAKRNKIASTMGKESILIMRK